MHFGAWWRLGEHVMVKVSWSDGGWQKQVTKLRERVKVNILTLGGSSKTGCVLFLWFWASKRKMGQGEL